MSLEKLLHVFLLFPMELFSLLELYELFWKLANTLTEV